MEGFLHVFWHYLVEIVPALAIGFFISGIVHELIPQNTVTRYLGSGGIKPILYSTIIGTALPICCWGSLPIAVSFYKKGARLGPIFAFLIATPATSISAIIVTYAVLGLGFAVYTFFAVVFIGVAAGLIGDRIKLKPAPEAKEGACPHCDMSPSDVHTHKRSLAERVRSILRYAYIELPKEIGKELLLGLLLASFVTTFLPVGRLIRTYLSGWLGYLFGVVFGIIMYICATTSIPLIDSLISQGMNKGAAMTLLLIGPVTSYGTMLVLLKEFGAKTLAVFLLSLITLTLIAGVGFSLLQL
jgi:uncharacterized membrane protein YraQ (UPF0718 family)